MNCKTAQSRILNSRHDAELEVHLAVCNACREFARALQVFARPISPPVLPAFVHEQILSSSRALMREHAHEVAHASVSTTRRLARGFALAAPVVLYCVMLLFTLHRFTFEGIGYLLLAVVIAQNLFAVLFSPLVFARLRPRMASAN